MNLLDTFQRWTPAALVDALFKQRYEAGNWMPGPNANFQLKHPHEMAKAFTPSSSSANQSAAAQPQGKSSTVPPPGTVTEKAPEAKASPEKPKRVRDRANEHSTSLREVVKKNGGINIDSLRSLGYDVKAYQESGLAYRGLLKEKGGMDVQQMAQMLHNEKHIQIPGVEEHEGTSKGSKTFPKESPEHLMSALLNKEKSLFANQESVFSREERESWEDNKHARQLGASESSIAESVRAGKAAGDLAAAQGGDTDVDSELAEEGGTDDEGADAGSFDPAEIESSIPYAKDASGHEHAPAGSSTGGQFTGKAEHGQSADGMASKFKQGSLFDEPSASAGQPTSKPHTAPPVEQKPTWDKQSPKGMAEFFKMSGMTAPDFTSKSPDDMAKTFAQPEASPALAKEPTGTPESTTGKISSNAQHLFGTLESNGDYPTVVKRAVHKAGVNRNDENYDDMMQEASLKIMQAADKWDESKGAFPDFAYMTALHEVQDKQRRSGTETRGGKVEKESLSSGMDVDKDKRKGGGSTVNAEELRHAISQLPELQQNIIAGLDEGKGLEEIAVDLGTNLTAVNRAKRKIKELLGNDKSKFLNEMLGDKSRYAVDKDGKRVFKFASTQLNITTGLAAKAIRAMSESIPDSDLAEEGREDKPHITVKYGLHTDDAEDVREIVEGFGPISVRFGTTKIFPAKEDDEDGQDVVYVSVESDALHRLNELISDELECTDKFPAYVPHVCLAYVKPGMGQKYVGMVAVDGEEITFDEIQFSNVDKEKTVISLAEKKRYEYGPRHSPPKRIEGAVARL